MDISVEKILQLMQQHNISATKLQNDLQLNKNAIYYWKNGRQKPSTETLNKIANYFNVSTDFLLGRPQYPTIEFSNSSFEWSAWYIEKLTNSLFNCASLIDRIKELKIEDEELIHYISETIYFILKMLSQTIGANIDTEESKIILEHGTIGYNTLLTKYDITQENINKLFTRHKNS